MKPMNYTGPRFIEKFVGKLYVVEFDKEEKVINIYFKSNLKHSLGFEKYGHAVTFYARMKQVKDITDRMQIHYREVLLGIYDTKLS